jgi:hypothetical protein
MHSNHDKVHRFVVLADIYFRLTGKSAGDMSGEEMEGLYALVAQCSSPDKFYKLVEYKIKIEDGILERTANIPADGWRMLPPEQRVL